MKFAVVFPGQGSQSVGMLAELYKLYPIIKQTFTAASESLDYDLWVVTQQGPAERLNTTDCTQPALLAAEVSLWRVWQAQGGSRPAFLAGHSLGEYTALVCAGAVDFKTAVKLVEFRGQAMQAAVPAGTGAMAAVLGLTDADVVACCKEVAESEVVAAVNFNAPGQVVIAGHLQAVKRAGELCKSKGAKRVIPLPVSVPSHCSLMRPAAERLSVRLQSVPFQTPQIPVIHNTDVAAHTGADAIRGALKAQLYSPVRWVETIEYLARQHVSKVVELGPGSVLAGLGKRIDKTLGYFPVFDSTGLDAALAAVKEDS